MPVDSCIEWWRVLNGHGLVIGRRLSTQLSDNPTVNEDGEIDVGLESAPEKTL